jgi:hypothetical protein
MKSSDLDVEMVNVADREDIIKYFTGQVQDTHCINQELKMQLMMAATNKTHKREEPVGGKYCFIKALIRINMKTKTRKSSKSLGI